MLHNWCFPDTNPIFSYSNRRFKVELFTDSNRYDLDPELTHSSEKEGVFFASADGLCWAGGQEKAAGKVEIRVERVGDALRFAIHAQKEEPIVRVKLVLLNLPLGKVIARRLYQEELEENGKIYRYPNGWDDLFTPLVVLKQEKGVTYFRSLDEKVTPKHFMLRKEGDSAYVELIHEFDARFPQKEVDVPLWEVGTALSADEVFEKQRVYLEKVFHFVKWEKRKDVPDWAKKISLLVAIHGMHWSGHIFSDYRDMEKKLDLLAGLIAPEKVLVYLPGFDGRYYFKYPDYSPDPRMGGEEGMKSLVEHAHRLGFHLMPMFMANGANPKTPGFEIWGEPSRYHGRNGYAYGVGSCDWDTARCYDLNCGVGLNPGAPLWQDRIVNEILTQCEKFHYDAIFLDLAAIYVNDPLHSTHEGMERMIARLHERIPSLLVATEGWYDALTPSFPLSQVAADGRDGAMIYHDTPYAPFFDDYCRAIGHLCTPDPAEHRTGVFEWGYNPTTTEQPLRKGIIPTLTIVGDTLEKALPAVKKT
ncbi:MAG: hypothetical protein J5736_03895, partial [Bacilli bacterium]|nr:hypothetical protein [Bacilli bacterium]